MRNTFIETLTSKAKLNKKIVLIIGDLGYNVVEKFRDNFPDRFYNAGIAEQNMASMAAGLASQGFHVFVYSIANFPTFRCAEQIRNDICYHNLNVTIVTVGGGLSYGSLGYSHHAIQDLGLMRLFPEMTILSPGDPSQKKLCLDYIL
jgi:transketolase